MVCGVGPAVDRSRVKAGVRAVCLMAAAGTGMVWFIVPFCKSEGLMVGQTTIREWSVGRLQRKSGRDQRLPAPFILDDDQTMTG